MEMISIWRTVVLLLQGVLTGRGAGKSLDKSFLRADKFGDRSVVLVLVIVFIENKSCVKLRIGSLIAYFCCWKDIFNCVGQEL